jgi:hypothetical protein
MYIESIIFNKNLYTGYFYYDIAWDLCVLHSFRILCFAFKAHSDGFLQNIKPWSQKNLLLGKHDPIHAQPTIGGYPLLGNGPVNTSGGNE